MPLEFRTHQNKYLESENSHLHSGVKNSYASEQLPSLILVIMSECRTFVTSGRDLIGMGS